MNQIKKMCIKFIRLVCMYALPSYRVSTKALRTCRELRARCDKLEYMWWLAQHRPGELMSETRKKMFLNMPTAEGPLREVQQILLEILCELDRICSTNGLSYWLLGGSVIGAIRHRGFIPWDDDADVGMMRSDYLKLKELLKGNERIELLEFYNFNGFYRIPKLVIKGMQDPYSVATIATDIVLFDYVDATDTSRAWRDNQIARRRLIQRMWWFKFRVLDLHTTQLVLNQHIKDKLDGLVDRAVEACGYPKHQGSHVVRGIDNFNNDFQQECIFTQEKIFPIKKLRFETLDLCVANKFEDLVAAEVGNIWQLPSDLGKQKFFSSGMMAKELARYRKATNA